MDSRISASPPQAQQGAAVLIMLIVVVLGASYYFVGALNRASSQVERDKITAAALAQAQEAVLGFALANQDMPGGLPFPDRNSDGEYTGNGDCINGPIAVNASHLLGKLPFLNEQGCGSDIRAFDIVSHDAAGERLWYAVSQALVKSSPPPIPGNPRTYPYPTNTSTLMSGGGWLTVRGESGAVLPDPVAFVLIAPGEVLAGQNRTTAAPSSQNYLDSFTVGAATYDNWDNDLAFIAARPLNDGATRFNDRVLYVTRDEFVNRLVERVAGEIRSRLDQYHLAHNQFPFAAPLPDGECVDDTASGFTPIADADPDCGGPLAALPAWWTLHEWQNVTHYTRASPDQTTVQFDLCASVFTFSWNATLNQSETLRSGKC